MPPEVTVIPLFAVIPLLAVSSLDTVTASWNVAVLVATSWEQVRSFPSYHPPAFARTHSYVATVFPPIVMFAADTVVTLNVAVLETLRLVKEPVAAVIVPVFVMSVCVIPDNVVDRFVTSFMECV